MTNPQLEDGHVRIANELFDAILRRGFSKRQLAVVLAVIRKTYGYQKKEDQLSASQVANMTGIPRQHVASTIVELEAMKVVLKRDGKHANSLSLNKNYGQWDSPKLGRGSPKTGHVPKQDGGSPETGLALVPKQDTQKTTPKDNTKRECSFEQFWAAYPRKVSKGNARRWYDRHKPNEQRQEAIMAGLARAKTSAQWAEQGGKFIPYPASWLNAEGWEDDVGGDDFDPASAYL